MKNEHVVEAESKRVVMETVVKADKKEIISHRKACDATGTGLSHYILMDKKGK
jgi:modified peptide precursor CbpA